MVSAYASSVKAAGFTMTRPDVRIYTGTIQTPCGQGLKGYPVFYCGSNETIYSSAGSTAEYGETLRLGGYWIVFHEFAHHVQQRAGVLAAAYYPRRVAGADQPPDRVAGGLPDGHDVDLGAQRQD